MTLSDGLATFDVQPRVRIVFGPGQLDRLGELAAELPARRILLVTDPGIVAAGHAARARGLLEAASIHVAVFDQVEENPTSRCVEACVDIARHAQIDGFVAIGGGSAMDTAKGCNFLLTNGGQMRDYWGVGKARLPMLPLIAVPTTTGTGSECQSFALISDPDSHQKMACGDPKAAPRIALLDPELAASQPPRVLAATGIDAIAHALESAVTRKRNGFSSLCAHQGFRLLSASLDKALDNPRDPSPMGGMQWGAALAGMAIEASMLGAAHSAANPLTARFGLTHGLAVGLMLPHVIRYNAESPAALTIYAELAQATGLGRDSRSDLDLVERLIARFEGWLDRCAVPESLAQVGLDSALIPAMAAEAAAQWTAAFNPRPADKDAFAALYEAALSPRPKH